jgi:hypothetical protein
MAAADGHVHDEGMQSMTSRPQPDASAYRGGAAERSAAPDPAKLLYEHAAGLLASAGGFDAASRTPGVGAALGPALACLEASLYSLAGAAEHLSARARERPDGGDLKHSLNAPVARGVNQRFRDLVNAIEAAQSACGYARDALGPVHSCRRLAR